MKRREFCAATVMGGLAAAFPDVRLLAAEAPVAALADLPAIKLSGQHTLIAPAAVRDFAASLRGELLWPGGAGYEQARRIWNGMIDRHPALIARCAGPADVASAVGFARAHELVLAVRGGGHSFPGFSACDGGLVIDLSGMRGVRVDPVGRTARAEGGAWGGDLDWEAQHHALATPLGEISNTGVAGLTLGGGFGWLTRRFGLACDNVVAMDLVTADGRLLRVSADDNPDLFWALRGGGGNFGVVTSFEYRLHPVGPKVLAGYLAFPLEQARDVLHFYAGFATAAPRDLSVDLELGFGLHGKVGATIYACYIGDPAQGERALQPLTRFGKPFVNTIVLQDYVQVQKQFDGPVHSPLNNYLKGGFLRQFTPGLIEALTGDFRPDETFGAYFHHSGGAVGDLAPADTAFPHRQAIGNLMMSGAWPDASDNDRNRATVRANWDKVARFTAGFYVNLNDADQKGTDDNYGSNYSRLAGLKKKYDPGNIFRLNANVRPAA